MINLGLLPAPVSFMLSYVYCSVKDIPFYIKNTSKSLEHKIFLNARNGIIGISIVYLLTNFEYAIMSVYVELCSMVVYSLLIELCVYVTHRYMHINKILYRHVHMEHHIEKHPSPIDAYILTIPETCLLTFCFIFPKIIGIPITLRGFLIVEIIHLTLSTLVHGGFTNIQHHMIHHKLLRGNYCGIYPLWDIVFGTYIKNV